MELPVSGTDQSPERIRAMFGSITPTYDRLNRLFSGTLDQRWRRLTADELTRDLSPCDRVLDVATGTGDLARAVRDRSGAHVTGLDFTRTMLREAGRKFGGEGYLWIEGDGTRLPVPTGRFDAACIAFGLRNMIDREACLRELARSLRPGGRLAVLEFSQPDNPIFARLYNFYSHRIMPRLGRLLSGSDAYLYLARSIRSFWSGDELARRMESAGLIRVRQIPLMLGVVRLHLATAPPVREAERTSGS